MYRFVSVLAHEHYSALCVGDYILVSTCMLEYSFLSSLLVV
jgi:hypothetical protein